MYAAGVALVLAGYLFLPSGPGWDVIVQPLVGGSAAGAILIGTRGLHLRDRMPWWFLALAVLTAAVQPLLVVHAADVIPGAGPDLPEYLLLAFFPTCAVALVLMIRRLRREFDRAALVDALTITTGLGLLAWVAAIEPLLGFTSVPIAFRLYIAAYPIGDLVLLTLTFLLLRSAGPGSGPAPFWIAGAIGGCLLGGAAWLVLGNVPADWAGMQWADRGVSALFMASLAALGMAAAHPVVRDDGPGAALQSRLSRVQLMVLTLGVMIAPVLLAVQALSGGVTNGVAIAVGSAVMFLLVLARMAQLLRQSEWQQRMVRELSRRDELTGLPNRRAWADELPRALERARADGVPITVGIIDLDHFKAYNDRYGHPAGDRLLKAAAAAWHSSLRRRDLLARYGGEEFIVLLPDADLTQARAVLERARTANPDGETFSAGLAAWDGTETSDDLIARADVALYAAKAAGRDRIMSADLGLPSVADVSQI